MTNVKEIVERIEATIKQEPDANFLAVFIDDIRVLISALSEAEKALERLLECPALADEDYSHPEWGCEETDKAISAARAVLKEF